MRSTVLFLFLLVTAAVAGRLAAQQGYTAITRHAIWGGPGERRDISLTSEEAMTDAGSVFRAETGCKANLLTHNGPYHFDYKLVEHVVTPVYTGPLTYYANSRDGSLAFTANDNPRLKAHLRDHLGKGELHFAIRKADGNLLVCGYGKTTGLPKNGDWIWAGIMTCVCCSAKPFFDQLTWLGNAEPLATEGLTGALTPGQIALLESTTTDGRRGRITRADGSSQLIDFYTVSFPVTVAVSAPFLGAGTGIMKNYSKHINQLVIYTVHRGIPWKDGRTNLHFYLDGLYSVEASFRPDEYRIVTAFNNRGWQIASSCSRN